MRNHLLFGAAVTALVMPAAASAQEITSRIEGQIQSEDGTPLANATVTITDTRTGATRTLQTGSTGAFNGENLSVGGPYTVTASAPGYEGQSVENITTTLQAATTLRFNLMSSTDGNVIVVTAQRANLQLRAIGPGQAFGANVLENVPSFSNDIRDVIRIDPRVSLDRNFEVDRVSCLGGNDRSNTFTVDGQVQADVFGLNGTPFASRTVTPLPYDAVRETSVEFAPFDVQYGQFTGCAINVVSKSGSNQIHGSGFFTYTSDKLNGKRLDGNRLTLAPFKEYRWGGTLSGPIIKDKLFLFFAYEESDTGDAQGIGPSGMGFANPQGFVTEGLYNEIRAVLRDTYKADPGPIAQTLPETSRRFFGRLDWQINNDHRLELTYQRLDETDIASSDLNATVLTGLNSFVNRGTQSNYYSGRLYSQWNDRLTTELRVSRSEVQDLQGPIGFPEAQDANPIPRIVVGVSNAGGSGSVVAGPSFFQSANDLYTEITQARFVGNLKAGDHTLTLGAEINQLDAFNLFVRNATGTLVFQNIDALRSGTLLGGTLASPTAANTPNGAAIVTNGGLGGAGAFGSFSSTGDINTAAASFKRTIFSIYAQDEWQATDQLRIQAGARVDWVDGGAPGINPEFQRRYGYSNAVPFSVLEPVVLPRLAITYDVDPFSFLSRTQIRAGVGIFSGGDPAVWFSNAFSNTGAQTGYATSANALCDASEVNGRLVVLNNGQFTGFPSCVRTAAQQEGARSLGRTESTDPDIKSPTVIRANFGVSTDLNLTGANGFFDDWRVNLDYIYSRYKNPFVFVDLAQTIDIRRGLDGFTRDGRPLYGAIDTFRADCAARLVDAPGPRPVYSNVTAACFGGTRTQEIQLTNADGYDGHVASFILSKRFEGGLFTEGGSSFVSLGYAYTNSKSRALNDDGTGANNFTRNATFDRQNPEIGTSPYETRHNITFAASFGNKIVDDLETRFGWVFTAREGRPFSYVFDSANAFSADSSTDNELIYVPTGVDDPNITGPDAVRQQFNTYIENNKCLRQYRGGVAPRGACRNDWYYDLDLQFSQELPGPLKNDKLRLIVNFDNFLNLLDSSWNVFRRKSAFNQNVPLANLNPAGVVDAQGRYVINQFNPFDAEAIQTNASLWRIQVGVRYNF